MADDKTESTTVQLVAVERGFYGNQMIEPGKSFTFESVGANGRPRKVPKWAVPAEAYKAKPAKPVAGDLKPKAAQAAVKQKAATLSGDSA